MLLRKLSDMDTSGVYKLAEQKGYDRVKKGLSWDGYEVWQVSDSELDGCRLGYPAYIISNNSETRFAKADERVQIFRYQVSAAHANTV